MEKLTPEQAEINRLKEIIRQYYNVIVEAGKIMDTLQITSVLSRMRGCVTRNNNAGQLSENKDIIT